MRITAHQVALAAAVQPVTAGSAHLDTSDPIPPVQRIAATGGDTNRLGPQTWASAALRSLFHASVLGQQRVTARQEREESVEPADVAASQATATTNSIRDVVAAQAALDAARLPMLDRPSAAREAQLGREPGVLRELLST